MAAGKSSVWDQIGLIARLPSTLAGGQGTATANGKNSLTT